jgi:DNA-binding transcriptional MerR regulator
MARTRSVETRLRDARAVELRRRGLTYQQIADQLTLSSAGKAHDAVRRGVLDSAREDRDEQTYLELERLDELIRTLYRVISTRHYATSSSGVVILDPQTKAPLIDNGPIIAAVNAMRQLSESRRKLLGLDAPSRARVEVITEDDLDKELADILAENARLEAEQEARDAGAGTD